MFVYNLKLFLTSILTVGCVIFNITLSGFKPITWDRVVRILLNIIQVGDKKVQLYVNH